MQTWVVDSGQQALILAAHDLGLPQVVYWGASLPDGTNLQSIAAAYEIDITGGMLDAAPPLSLSPEAWRNFPGQPGLIVQAESGQDITPRFVFKNEAASQNTLTLTYRDADNELTLCFEFEAHKHTHIITARSIIKADRPIRVTWLAAPVMPAPQNGHEIWDFSGRWCGEFHLNTTPWQPGIRLRENRTGRSGHEHFPGLLLPCNGATNSAGNVFAMHYGWPGGHRMVAEELPDGRRQVQFGHASFSETRADDFFETAPLFLAYSQNGLNGCATAFQRHVRDHIVTWPAQSRPRPVHYNCWEAVYFKHNLEELKDIASRVADLGAERFVLDDGWFGSRNNDTSSLGDWHVDPAKFPDGLTPLISHVKGEGMQFGLWFEPEMVNPDSDLYRTHPDWALGSPDQTLGRQQMVLNMAREDVRQYLYDRIAAILSGYDINYVKWDHNRVLPGPDATQARGTLAVLEQLRAAFPTVEIESCASGGGRLDFGMLAHTQRVWLSDSNDALERLAIQHNAALFLPMVVTGSHVGPRKCHTSGRIIDMSFRAWIAAQRHMGFEMDPRELDDYEARVLKKVTSWWKGNRAWLEQADILRLESSDAGVTAEQHLANEKDRLVVFAARHSTSDHIIPRPLRLTGLEPNAQYQIKLLNPEAAPKLSRGTPALKSGPLTLPGAYLMDQGVTLPWSFPETMWVLEGLRQ